MEVKYKKEDFFQIFSHISIFFTTLDVLTTILLVNILDGKNFSKEINDKTTLGKKFKIIENLKEGITNQPEILAKVKDILPELNIIAEERNRYIHDMWEFNESLISTGKIYRHKSRVENQNNKNIWKTEKEELTMKDLYKFLGKIGEAQAKVGEILKQLKEMKFIPLPK